MNPYNIKLKYIARIKDGKLIFNNQKQMIQEVIKAFPPTNHIPVPHLEVVFRKKRTRRSLDQNKYYWGVVVPMYMHGLNMLGWQFDLEQTHEYLKERFNRIQVVNTETGELKNITGSTTRNSTVQQEEYHSLIRQSASEDLGIEIPMPNEQISLQLSQTNEQLEE